MGHDVLKKFDRYFLLDLLAQGGMAEIFRARPATPDGAGRLLVIKRILASYGKNPEFQKMFKSEIKVMMGFNHPNIVHFYDYGEFKNQPFIAMEFCDGHNLKQFVHRLLEQKKLLPIEMSCYIIEQVANGLHYAHVFKDKISGESLQLVHRDVSPHNILVTYDGGVKIIDFGIAKATTNSEQTRVGVIKGKPPYLSPEQITGQNLDGRSDVFALGATLWEALTGRKLFLAKKGENEFAVLKLIESADSHVKPPSTINSEIPKELDEIVLKALVRDREHRYQSCDDFARALRQFLNQRYSKFSPSDLSQLAKQIFKDEIVEDRKKLAKLNAEAEKLLNDDFTVMTHAGKRIADAAKAPAAISDVDANAIDTTGIKIERPSPGSGNAPKGWGSGLPVGSSGSSSGIDPSVSGSGISVGGLGNAKTIRRGSGSGPSLKPTSSSNNFLRLGLSAVATIAAVVFLFSDSLFKTEPAPKSQSEMDGALTRVVEPMTPVKSPENRTGTTIILELDIRPLFAGTKITLNGKPVDPADPSIEIPFDEGLELRISNTNFHPFERQFVIYSKDYVGVTHKREEINLEPLKFGYLNLSTDPATSKATIRPWDEESRSVANDQAWITTPPLNRVKLPVGSYLIRVESKVLEMSKEFPVKIEEGQVVTHDRVRMEYRPIQKGSP